MPLRLSSRPLLGRSVTLSVRNGSISRPICLFCSLGQSSAFAAQSQRRSKYSLRRQYSAAAAATLPESYDAPPRISANPRKELLETLLRLQKEAGPYINLSRLRLALQNLRQNPGQESIRVAILALGNLRTEVAGSSGAAKSLLKVLLADPLSPAADWEKQLESHDLAASPLVVRIGRGEQVKAKKLGEVEFQPQQPQQQRPLLRELSVDSPNWNDHHVEMLVMESNGFGGTQGEEFEERALVPTVEIQSAERRFSGVTTPVHKTLIVGQGFEGAATVASLPAHGANVVPVANIPNFHPDRTKLGIRGYHLVDLPLAEEAIGIFRKSVSDAMRYERLWFDANMPDLLSDAQHETISKSGETKGLVRDLVYKLLANTERSLDQEAARRREFLSRKPTMATDTQARLEKALGEWSEQAHRELQEGLDAAFQSRSRWHRLGWWRLFWRVDDVSMVASDAISRHFLVDAERRVVYLAGRMDEAGIFKGTTTQGYLAPKPFTREKKDETPGNPTTAAATSPNQTEPTPTSLKQTYTTYPTNITHTRAYLTLCTVPSLQALAQTLLVQTASTAGTTSALGLLMFLSGDFSPEAAGAVALLGTTWALRRMQRRWEAARAYWEDGVWEEGRKAVRAVEESVAEAMHRRRAEEGERMRQDERDLGKVRGLLQRAREVLAQLK